MLSIITISLLQLNIYTLSYTYRLHMGILLSGAKTVYSWIY